MTTSLRGKKLWLYPMTLGGARALAAAWRAFGVDAEVIPPSDETTLSLAAAHTSGDECLPQLVTLGDLLRIARRPDYDPSRTAFFFATATGPCRFGQYTELFRLAFRREGLGEPPILAPSSDDGYGGIGAELRDLTRVAWWALVGADLLQKVLHRIRPYETRPGAADEAYEEGLEALCTAIEKRASSLSRWRSTVLVALAEAGEAVRAVPTRYEERPLIGIVGEMFCRHHTFSNQDLIRRLEWAGGEAWLSDLGEWIWYCNEDCARTLALRGRRLSFAMLGARLSMWVQRREERALLTPLQDLLRGREEPESPSLLLDLARPYLPYEGASGEMVLSVGKSIYLARHGVHGVIDVSPFTCMNGIVSEAIYPRLSRDLNGLPIKGFTFDGKPAPVDRDLQIFLDLARGYAERGGGLNAVRVASGAGARGSAGRGSPPAARRGW